MDTKTLNRREFLRIAGLSTAPLALPGWAPAWPSRRPEAPLQATFWSACSCAAAWMG